MQYLGYCCGLACIKKGIVSANIVLLGILGEITEPKSKVTDRGDHMQTLYIIGNGFDCYGHNMPTRYADFRQYLVSRFPDYQRNYGGTLEFSIQNDGAEAYDMNEVVGAIIRTIDECSKPGWSDLEKCLGGDFVYAIAYENEWAFEEPQFDDDDDNSIFHSVYENEDISNAIVGAYEMLMELFADWVHHKLGKIDYHRVPRLRKKPSFKNSLFLNFNYTRTLEQVYGINPVDVCHIHGDVYDGTEDIYFGHGNDEEFEEFNQYIGITDAFSNLKRSLRKNTLKALRNNEDFFARLSKVNKIYSYGFSFSDVDMPYIEEIANRIVPSKTRWYLNKYDIENHKNYIEMIEKLGFKLRKCKRW